LDGFGGGLITEEVAVGWVVKTVDAVGLHVLVHPALAWVVEIVKGPVAFEDSLLEGAAN
jgi:hypothetical protein